MEENKDLQLDTPVNEEATAPQITPETDVDDIFANEKPLDKNVRLMSPGRMVMRRFFRSKLSIAGIVMLAALFIFCF